MLLCCNIFLAPKIVLHSRFCCLHLGVRRVLHKVIANLISNGIDTSQYNFWLAKWWSNPEGVNGHTHFKYLKLALEKIERKPSYPFYVLVSYSVFLCKWRFFYSHWSKYLHNRSLVLPLFFRFAPIHIGIYTTFFSTLSMSPSSVGQNTFFLFFCFVVFLRHFWIWRRFRLSSRSLHYYYTDNKNSTMDILNIQR